MLISAKCLEEDIRLSEEALERLSERLVNRVEKLNTYMIEKLGKQIVDIGTFTPSQVREVLQSVKYGNNLDEIMNEIADVSEKNVSDIYKIFEEVAKKNQNYAKQFYEYTRTKFIPYEQNETLQEQVKSIAKATANEYMNMSKTFAYMKTNAQGVKEYTKISDIYQKITDEAILNIVQGRESYDMTMRKTMKEMTSRGLRTVDFNSGYSRRADSSIRMNVMDGIRRLNQELQKSFGEEFGADGVEISHHKNAAPDHIDTVDGRQFSKKGAVTIKSIRYEDYDTVNNSLDRHVGELNCYHFTYQIVLGVSKPIYSKEQLEADKKANKDGFEFEGKHYTNYEGTQLQRQIETKIRQYKDRQIGARAIDNAEEVYHCQEKIRLLTNKYNDLHKVSGLPTKIDRLRVEGYKKLNISKSLFSDNIITRDFKNKSKKVESMIIYDMKTRKKIYTTTSNKRSVVGDLKAYGIFATAKPNSLATAHNHPSNTSFSKKDIMTFNKFKSIDSLFVETDDYTYYLIKNNIQRIESKNLEKIVTDIRNMYYNKYGKTKESMHLVNEIISKKIGWNYGRVKK
ncbi:MAG: hypothetical protein Q4E39_05210 [bacterium]|nr:hypothetical protein [bacterium]